MPHIIWRKTLGFDNRHAFVGTKAGREKRPEGYASASSPAPALCGKESGCRPGPQGGGGFNDLFVLNHLSSTA